MKLVRDAAKCLSSVCRAPTDPAIKPVLDLFDKFPIEAVPVELEELLARLK